MAAEYHDGNVRAECPDCRSITTFESRDATHEFGYILVEGHHLYEGSQFNRTIYVLLRCASCHRGGLANVQIDAAFASVTDHRWYYVFLTPLGDTSGLYVSIKTPTAFQVRETEHGHDTLSFDYRIVAHALDAKDARFPLAPAVRQPPQPRHPSQ
jgi:hypothetical protein